jgi:hypothetical protein
MFRERRLADRLIRPQLADPSISTAAARGFVRDGRNSRLPATMLAAKIQRSKQLMATPELLLQLPGPLFDEVLPPELSMAGCLSFVLVGLTFLFINLAILRKTAPRAALQQRQLYVKRQLFVFLALVLLRWAMYAAARHWTFGAWLFCLPLNVFETWCAQRHADLYEGRTTHPVSFRAVRLCLKVALAEIVAVTFLHRIQEPWLRTAGPAGAPLARAALGGCLLFDIGVDLAFYTLHRACHENRQLYKWVHREHHTLTGYEGGLTSHMGSGRTEHEDGAGRVAFDGSCPPTIGAIPPARHSAAPPLPSPKQEQNKTTHSRLVAWDTYEISWTEMTLIELGYAFGFGLVLLAYGEDFTLLDLAISLTWAHLVELLGHTSMSWTWNGNPLRLLQETMGLDLKVADHRCASQDIRDMNISPPLPLGFAHELDLERKSAASAAGSDRA